MKITELAQVYLLGRWRLCGEKHPTFQQSETAVKVSILKHLYQKRVNTHPIRFLFHLVFDIILRVAKQAQSFAVFIEFC